MSKIKQGVIWLIAGAVVAFSPLAMAFFATAPGHNMWSEGDSKSGGTYIWGMLMTLPLGFLSGLVGLIIIIRATITPTTTDESGEVKTNPKAKLPAIVMIVLGALFAMMWVPTIFSIIGAVMFLAGAAVVWQGIRLLRKPKR